MNQTASEDLRKYYELEGIWRWGGGGVGGGGK